MENQTQQQSTVVSEPSTVNVAQTPSTVDRSQPSFLVMLLSVLLLISTIVAGFFAYQTQKLASELRFKNEDLRMAAPATQKPTTEPVATDSATIDTSNWKTYNNSLFQFNFKYPKEFDLVDNLQKSIDPMAWTTRSTINLDNSTNKCSVAIMVNPDGFGPFFSNKLMTLSYLEDRGLYVTKETPNAENLTSDVYSLIGSGAVDKKVVNGVFVSSNCPDTTSNRKYLDEQFGKILSTFKFIN